LRPPCKAASKIGSKRANVSASLGQNHDIDEVVAASETWKEYGGTPTMSGPSQQEHGKVFCNHS